MKTLICTIRPTSGFGTTLKGDTIFGHLCWQIARDPALFGKTLDDLLADYDRTPFLIASSAAIDLGKPGTPRLVLKRPALPFQRLFPEQPADKSDKKGRLKELKKKTWFLTSPDQPSAYLEKASFLDDEEVFRQFEILLPIETKKRLRTADARLMRNAEHWHNSINRLTGATGEGGFAPFMNNETYYLPRIQLSCIFGIDDGLSVDALRVAMTRIGTLGFGRDASTGLGKFEVIDLAPIDLGLFGSPTPNAAYCLGPSVPAPTDEQPWFTPFVRYGRHGDELAVSPHPFKNPCLMADEAAVYPLPKHDPSRPWVGKALRGLSSIEPRTVGQGFSLYIPVQMEVAHA
ncbi:MAG TPA: hypothetical protein PLP29_04690 [Candidatus Ozemobacteraceae bacterium]|nr:hypothetical protein [Candidatus Ozemobacteraceae bacterium]